MIQKKVLLISTYPIVGDDLTGGPLRVAAIVDTYKKHFTAVKHVAIFSKYHHPHNFAATDIAVRGELAEQTRMAPNTSDYLIGQAIEADPVLRADVLQMLLDYKPDVIEVEQVFPYIGLRALLAELPFKPVLIHSSHNIEYPMKQEIMQSLGHDEAEIKKVVSVVERAEKQLVREADLVIAVTDTDGEQMVKMGATRYVLARNGMSALTPSQAAISYWEQYFTERSIDSFALFVGSAHPPNMLGFRSMIGTGMGFLKPGHALVLAGSVGDNIFENLKPDSFADITCHRRLINAGRLPLDKLQALLLSAHTLLLPIVEGGGSNLKTAEAFLAHKHIVATSKALRSFESFADFTNVSIADKPAAFRQAIATSLDQPAANYTKQEVERTRSLLWENCLQAMVEEVSRL